MKNYFVYIASIFLVALISCNPQQEKKVESTEVVVANADTAAVTVPEVKVEEPVISTDSSLTLLTKEILLELKNKNYESFAKYIHPEEGCLFSPYGFIDTVNSVVLKPADFIKALKNDNKITWGSYDGSGDPIDKTPKTYLQNFVYNADFLNAKQFAVNKILASGNSLNNIPKVFPGLNFTESYFPGFKKENQGMDWTTLRFIFKKYGEKYYLRAVIHDQWTT